MTTTPNMDRADVFALVRAFAALPPSRRAAVLDQARALAAGEHDRAASLEARAEGEHAG